MKRLSLASAARCEAACHKRCRCRCGGAFHGTNRAAALGERFFQELPEEDPHFALPKGSKGQRSVPLG